MNFQSISLEECRNILKNSSLFGNGNLLYKGITSIDPLPDFLIIEPWRSVRPSKTATINGNAYNLLLNNLEAWSNFPRRMHSVIMTNSFEIARSYTKLFGDNKHGELYHVYPLDPCDLVICPTNDIFYSFNTGLRLFKQIGRSADLVNFNHLLNEIVDGFGYYRNYDQEWVNFISTITAISQSLIVPKLSTDSQHMLESIRKHSDNPIGLFEKAFCPNLNDFIKISSGVEKFHEILKSKPNREIWTGSSCVLVKYDVLNAV